MHAPDFRSEYKGQAFDVIETIDQPAKPEQAREYPQYRLLLSDGTETVVTGEEIEVPEEHLTPREYTAVIENDYRHHRTTIWILVRNEYGLVDAKPFARADDALEVIANGRAMDVTRKAENLTRLWEAVQDSQNGSASLPPEVYYNMRTINIEGIFPYLTWQS